MGSRESPSENEGVDTDEEGREAQREQLQVLIVAARPQRLARHCLGLREGKPTAERVAGGGSRKGEMLCHTQQLTPCLRFEPAQNSVNVSPIPGQRSERRFSRGRAGLDGGRVCGLG